MKNLNSDRIAELSELIASGVSTPDLVYKRFLRNVPYNMNGVRGSLLAADYALMPQGQLPFDRMDESKMLSGTVKVKNGVLKVGTGEKFVFLQSVSRVEEIGGGVTEIGILMFSDASELSLFLRNIGGLVCYGVISDPVIYDADQNHILMVDESGECCTLEALAATDFDYVQDSCDLSRSFARKGDFLVLGTPGVISFLRLENWERRKAEVLEFSILRKAV